MTAVAKWTPITNVTEGDTIVTGGEGEARRTGEVTGVTKKNGRWYVEVDGKQHYPSGVRPSHEALVVQ